MKTPEERLEQYIKEYKNDWRKTLDNMKQHYGNEDEYWWVIEQLLDKIVDLESEVN